MGSRISNPAGGRSFLANLDIAPRSARREPWEVREINFYPRPPIDGFQNKSARPGGSQLDDDTCDDHKQRSIGLSRKNLFELGERETTSS